MPIILRPAGDDDLSRARLHDDAALPQTIDGLDPGTWSVGRVIWASAPVTVTAAPPDPDPGDPGTSDPVDGALSAPANLFTAAQTSFATTDHVDGRGNWQMEAGRLVCLGTNAGQDARLSLDATLTAGEGHYILVDHFPGTAGNIKLQLNGAGTYKGNALTDAWQTFDYVPAISSTGAYTRVGIKPDTTFDGAVGNVRLYPLGAVDPNTVACDIVIVAGDSNSTCATSELVTADNREIPFDPRIWYMPSLREGGNYNDALAKRHVPMPAIEPVVGVSGAKRMSPCHAVASELVEWSAARGRPLLILSVGEAGTGLDGTEDWRKGSTFTRDNGTQLGSRAYDEMLATVAAAMALGPAHEVVGVVWSLGANDRYGGDYSVPGQWMDQMTQLVANTRADVADVPMVLWSVGSNLGVGYDDGRSQRMRDAQLRLDRDSGDADWAIDRFRVVTPPDGYELIDGSDPHYTAAGMQAKGRLAGATLRALLPSA